MPIFVVLLFWCFQFMSVTFVLGDVGTAGIYFPPFLPTECHGSDPTQFPTSNLFAAAGDGAWDNGASCGRQYLVRCISARVAGTCIEGQTIQVRVIDYVANPNLPNLTAAGTSTIILSETAYKTIAAVQELPPGQNNVINIEFQLV